MGTYKKGIMGAFSGTVGPVVGSSFRGANVMRSKPRSNTRPPSEKQLLQRAKFAEVIELLNPAKELLSTYYGIPEGTKSRYNLAVSYHLNEAIAYVNSNLEILYDQVMYAKGTLLPAENLHCTPDADGTLQLTWNNKVQAGCKPTDQLMVVVFEPESKAYAFFMKIATRADAEAVLPLPPQWNGKSVHVYGFMASENGKANSGSLYLGKFRVLGF